MILSQSKQVISILLGLEDALKSENWPWKMIWRTIALTGSMFHLNCSTQYLSKQG